MGQLEHFLNLGWNAAELQVPAFGASCLHEPHQGSQAAAVHKLEPIELQYDIAVFLDGISYL